MVRIKHFLSKQVVLAGILLILGLGILWFWSNHNYLEINTPTVLYSGAFTHDHEHIIVSGQGDTIYIHDATTGDLAHTLSLSPSSAVYVDLYPTEDLMAVTHDLIDLSYGDNRVVSLIDLQGRLLHNVNCHDAPGGISSVAWSAAGAMLAIGYSNGSACVDDYLQSAYWSPDGCLLATAAGPTHDDREMIIRFSPFMTDIVLWDTYTWKPVRYLKGHAKQATDIDWSSDSQQLLTVDYDGKAIIHDVGHAPCQ